VTISNATVGTPTLDGYLADKPLFLLPNRLENYSRGKWVATDEYDALWDNMPDITAVGAGLPWQFPVSRATDQYAHIGTRALASGEPGDVSATNSYSLMFDLSSAGRSATETFYRQIDSVAIYPGNFDVCSPTGRVDVDVLVSDSPLFMGGTNSHYIAHLRSSGIQNARTKVGKNSPLVECNLWTPNKGVLDTWYWGEGGDATGQYYFNFDYILFRFTTAPAAYLGEPTAVSGTNYGNFTEPPLINEIFLTKRHQLSRNSSEPFSDYSSGTASAMFESKSGVRHRYTKHAGGRVWSHTCKTKTGPVSEGGLYGAATRDLYGLTDWQTLKAIWVATDFGVKTHCYIPKPFSTQQALKTAPSGRQYRYGHSNCYRTVLSDETFFMNKDDVLGSSITLDCKEVFPYLPDLVGGVYPATSVTKNTF